MATCSQHNYQPVIVFRVNAASSMSAPPAEHMGAWAWCWLASFWETRMRKGPGEFCQRDDIWVTMDMLKASQTDWPWSTTLLPWLEVFSRSFTSDISKCSTFVQKHLISLGLHSCSNWADRSTLFCTWKWVEQSWDREGHSPHVPSVLTVSSSTPQWHHTWNEELPVSKDTGSLALAHSRSGQTLLRLQREQRCQC